VSAYAEGRKEGKKESRKEGRKMIGFYALVMKIIYSQCSKSPLPGKLSCMSLWYQWVGEYSYGCVFSAIITVTAT